jgi:hypothetical protein
MEYWLAMGLAILGGVLVGIVCTSFYFAFLNDIGFDEEWWWDDED